MVQAIDGNGLEQMLILRRHLLPSEDDSDNALARAVWLHQRQQSDLETTMANAVAKAFSGK